MATLRITTGSQLYDWLLLASGVPHADIGVVEWQLNLIGLSATYHTDQNREIFDVYVSPCVDIDILRADAALSQVIAPYLAGCYPCSTPDCHNYMPEDGDLCPPCKTWLEASDPVTLEDLRAEMSL